MPKPKKVNKFVYWIPRILSILLIIFLSLFSLDVFGNNYGFWGTMLALFMHNIPSIALLIILVISWKHEIVGAIAFFLAGLSYIALLPMNGFQWYELAWAIQISGPAFIIGILFLIGWMQKKKGK
jgi:hypothetical protein